MFEASGIRRCEDGSIDSDYFVAAAKDRRSEAAIGALKRFKENAFDVGARIFAESARQRRLTGGRSAA